MEPNSDELHRNNQVRSLQVTVSALMVGVLFFAGVAIYLRESGAFAMQANVPVVSIVASGYLATMIVARPFVLKAMRVGARKRLDETGDNSEGAWLSVFGGQTLIGAALLEGGAFLFLVAYLLEGTPWSLAGAFVMLGLMAYCHFPTRDRVERFLAEQIEAGGAGAA